MNSGFFDENEERAIMENELAAVLDDLTFRKAPSLSKLLRYLVNESIAGRGEGLKSYIVYVDGLSKPETHSKSADSLARVSKIRLQNRLERYYAKHSVANHRCLYLETASFVVRIGELSDAYPHLRRSSTGATKCPLGGK